MRKIDKQLNIANANLLSEQRYLTIKEGLDEDWKTNLAAGIATAGGVAGAHAQQAPQQSQNQQAGTTIQNQTPKQDNSGVADPFNVNGKDMSATYGHTKPIFKIQTGVQDGRTGQPSVYVYHKDPNQPGFNPDTDRTTVFTKNLDMLQKTREYQDYQKRMHAQAQQARQTQQSVNESDKLNLLENFNSFLKRIL